MEVKKLETEVLVHSIKLVDGIFSPSQANDVIRDLIDTKINYHKLSRLSLTEGNHDDKAPYDNDRLDELSSEKKRLIDAIKIAKQNGKKIKLTSLIDIEYLD